MRNSQTVAALPSNNDINELDEPPFNDTPVNKSHAAALPTGGSSRNGSSMG